MVDHLGIGTEARGRKERGERGYCISLSRGIW
jgi:hypothetical protein